MRITAASILASIVLLAPSVAQAAYLYFAPPAGTVCEGSTLTVDILLDSPDEAINAGQVDLTFNPANMQMVGIQYLDSIFRFWAEGPEYSNGAGNIHMVGGLPTPGFQGNGALIAHLTLRTTAAGDPQLRFSPTSDILLDDGYGTSTAVTFGEPAIPVVPSTDPRCAATPAPTPSPAFRCSPGIRTVGEGESATFGASGGTPPYTWSGPSGSPKTGFGSSFTQTYADLGTYPVTLTDAQGRVDVCRVVVAPPQTPAPTPTPCPVCPGFAPPPPPFEMSTTELQARQVLGNIFSPAATQAIVQAVYGNRAPLQFLAILMAVGMALTTLLALLQIMTVTGGVMQAGMMLVRNLISPAAPDRRRRLIGIVYDSITKSPIAGVKVELLSKENRLLETRFTDRDGRYGFVLSAESMQTREREVQIRAIKKDYRFPSNAVADERESMAYKNIYRGGLLVVSEDKLLSHDIPMDPERTPVFAQRRVPVGVQIARWIASFAEASFKVGLVLAPLNFALQPSVFNGVVLGVYAVLLILRMLGATFRPYGLVVNLSSGYAMPYALITLGDAGGTRVGHAVSDDRGRYFLLAGKGSYVLEAFTPAQIQPGRSLRRVISTRKGWIGSKLRF